MIKFNDNPDHSPLITAEVVGDNFEVTITAGSLPPNTTYHFDSSYTVKAKGHQDIDQNVVSDASGGLACSKPLATIYGPVAAPTALQPGIVDVWIALPGSLGTLGQPADFPDGGTGEIYGKLKVV